MSESREPAAAAFSVVGGNPTPEELAVVVALLQAASASASARAAATEVRPTSSWSRNASQLRVPVAPGAGQWQAAYRRGLAR